MLSNSFWTHSSFSEGMGIFRRRWGTNSILKKNHRKRITKLQQQQKKKKVYRGWVYLFALRSSIAPYKNVSGGMKERNFFISDRNVGAFWRKRASPRVSSMRERCLILRRNTCERERDEIDHRPVFCKKKIAARLANGVIAGRKELKKALLSYWNPEKKKTNLALPTISQTFGKGLSLNEIKKGALAVSKRCAASASEKNSKKGNAPSRFLAVQGSIYMLPGKKKRKEHLGAEKPWPGGA